MDIREFCGVDHELKRPDGTEITPEEIYVKVVEELTLETCTEYFPATNEGLTKAYHKDKLFNTIPLKYWDMKHDTFNEELKRIGITEASLSDSVGVLKTAAAIYVQKLQTVN